jgi:LysM repeat protein
MIIGCIPSASALPAEPGQRSTAATASAPEEENSIVYELRAGEDPSKVARMFHVTLDELLSLNHVADPRRLSVGATLKIPDPRATLVAELRAEKDGIQRQLSSAQGTINDLQKTVHRLESQISSVQDTNETLLSEAALYHIWRTGVMVTGSAAAVLAFALLIVWGKGRDTQRRYVLALRESEVLRTAVEKYRQLSAHFELRYQNIFHRVRLPPAKQARRQALSKAFAEDREQMDTILAEAEREIKRATAALQPEPSAAKYGKALLIRLSAARKNAD